MIERLAYSPDWMLNLRAKPLLQQLATQNKISGPTRGVTPREAQAQRKSGLSDEERAQVSEWRQYDATPAKGGTAN